MKSNYLKMLLMVFVISLFANNLSAQGVYVNINAGYGFNMSSQNLDYFDFSNYTNDGNTSSNEQVYVSLGKGLNVGGAFGYMFNKNFGAELGISYLAGGKTTASDNSEDVSYPHNDDYAISAKMLRFMPSLVVASGFEKVNLYAKFGLIMGTGTILFDYKSIEDESTYKDSYELDGGLALGLASGIGAIFNLSEKVSLFTEVNLVNLSFGPDKGEITLSEINGEDQLPNMSVRDKQIEFVDSYTENDNAPHLETQPSKELKQMLPFGSIGLNVGFRFSF